VNDIITLNERERIIGVSARKQAIHVHGGSSSCFVVLARAASSLVKKILRESKKITKRPRLLACKCMEGVWCSIAPSATKQPRTIKRTQSAWAIPRGCAQNQRSASRVCQRADPIVGRARAGGRVRLVDLVAARADGCREFACGRHPAVRPCTELVRRLSGRQVLGGRALSEGSAAGACNAVTLGTARLRVTWSSIAISSIARTSPHKSCFFCSENGGSSGGAPRHAHSPAVTPLLRKRLPPTNGRCCPRPLAFLPARIRVS